MPQLAKKNKHAVHFSSKRQDWETPQWLFDELNKEFGPFELDVCASSKNAKCYYYCGPPWESYDDGLETDWHKPKSVMVKGGNSKQLLVMDTSVHNWRPKACWMNPPYGREIGKWVKKAYEESQKGCLVVALLPSRTDTQWFHTYIYKKPGVETRMLKGRLKFGGATNSAPFPSMVVIFRPPMLAVGPSPERVWVKSPTSFHPQHRSSGMVSVDPIEGWDVYVKGRKI